MDNENGKNISRRELLNLGASVVGAGFLGSLDAVAGITGAGEPAFGRALVCIYLFGGAGETGLVSELHELRQRGALQVLSDWTEERNESTLSPGEVMAQRYAGLRFLPDGCATLEWAARMAGMEIHESAGAYRFKSGLSLVVPGGPVWQGDQFENEELRRAMDQTAVRSTTFPDTVPGRQLADVSRLLLASRVLGVRQPVFLCAIGGFTQSAQERGTVAVRHGELSEAMAAFHAATVALGVERYVTTYTDSESRAVRSSRTRLVMGGAATEGALAETRDLNAGRYEESLARWQGTRTVSQF